MKVFQTRVPAADFLREIVRRFAPFSPRRSRRHTGLLEVIKS